MNIQNLIHKQAQAIRTEDNHAKAAKLLAQAAELLKQIAPTKSTFMRDSHETRLKNAARFSDAINKNRRAKWEAPLLKAGWVKESSNAKEEIWGHKGRTEKIKINGKKFSVKAGARPADVCLQPEASLEFLGDYLKQKK